MPLAAAAVLFRLICLFLFFMAKPTTYFETEPNRSDPNQARDNYFVTVGLSFVVPSIHPSIHSFIPFFAYPFYFSILFISNWQQYFFCYIHQSELYISATTLALFLRLYTPGWHGSCKIYKSSSNFWASSRPALVVLRFAVAVFDSLVIYTFQVLCAQVQFNSRCAGISNRTATGMSRDDYFKRIFSCFWWIKSRQTCYHNDEKTYN